MQADFNLISSSINNTVRHLRNSDSERAYQNFNQFIQEAPKAPGYSRIAQQVALEDSARFFDKEVFEGRMNIKQASNKHLSSAFSIKEFWGACKKEADVFKESFKKMYPKSWKKRLAIESFMHETMGEVKPASNFKFAKKVTLFINRFSKSVI